MAHPALFKEVPIPEQTLRELSKDILGIVPKFADQEPDSGVK